MNLGFYAVEQQARLPASRCQGVGVSGIRVRLACPAPPKASLSGERGENERENPLGWESRRLLLFRAAQTLSPLQLLGRKGEKRGGEARPSNPGHVSHGCAFLRYSIHVPCDFLFHWRYRPVELWPSTMFWNANLPDQDFSSLEMEHLASCREKKGLNQAPPIPLREEKCKPSTLGYFVFCLLSSSFLLGQRLWVWSVSKD